MSIQNPGGLAGENGTNLSRVIVPDPQLSPISPSSPFEGDKWNKVPFVLDPIKKIGLKGLKLIILGLQI